MKIITSLFLLSIAAASPSIRFDSDGKYMHGQYVTVRWAGVDKRDRSSCWLGLFFHGANLSYAGKSPFPASPPYLESAPIKFINCSSSNNNFTRAGAGSRSIRLLAYRTPLEVAIFSGGYTTDSVPKLLARSHTPMVASDGAEPRYPRLARTIIGDEMSLTWSSLDRCSTLAELLLSNGSLHQQVWSIVNTYNASNLCQSPANSSGFADPGFHHNVVFNALRPGKYLYRVGSLQGSFSTSDSKSVRIGVIADVGATEPDGMHYHSEEPMASTTYTLTFGRKPDLVLHLGDLSYATGYAAKWDLFLEQMTLISARVPYMTALGNHEQDVGRNPSWPPRPESVPHALGENDSGGECAIPTYTRFPMLVESDQASGWYHFPHGPVAIVIINSEWNVSAGSRQHSFLRRALGSIDRSVTPWVVVGCHRPIYDVLGRADSMLGRDDVEDLLREFEVDFMLYGHIHNAQRTCPIYRGKCTRAKQLGGFPGTVHAVIGNGGAGLTPFPHQRPPWSLFQEFGWGFNELEVNLTTAVLRFFGDNGTLLDETAHIRPFPRSDSMNFVV